MALVETTRPHDPIDAEARGKLRVFKQAVAPTAAAIDRVIAEERALRAATCDLARKRGVGQQRPLPVAKGGDADRTVISAITQLASETWALTGTARRPRPSPDQPAGAPK